MLHRELLQFAVSCVFFSGCLAATELPGGFAEALVTGGIKRPTAMAFAPDGRLFVLEQDGTCVVIKNGVLLPTPFVTMTVDSIQEGGMVGIVLDPDFATNGWVYIYHTLATTPRRNRIIRWTANGDVHQPGSQVIIKDFEPMGSSPHHYGGAMHFGPDGKLYVAIGENSRAELAQVLSSTLGKILRLNKDGSIPSDNPVCNTQELRCAVWAMGLRNPFTFAIQPGTGRMYINDVGALLQEEINEATAGDLSSPTTRNYGWPTTEGSFNPTQYPQFRNPVYAYAHPPPPPGPRGECAIIGGVFYNPAVNNFPAQYTGKYFFADHCGSWIKTLDPVTKTVEDFASNILHPVDVRLGPDGALYYLGRQHAPGEPGAVYKIFVPGNSPEVTQQPVSATVAVGRPATFTVAAVGSGTLTYQWQRNGVVIPGATSTSYTITSPQLTDSGASFRVVVTNSFGSTVSAAATLTVNTNRAPVGTITSPANGASYTAGQTFTYSGFAIDLDEGELPPSAFKWEVLFHHDEHSHPFVPPTSGARSGSFTIPVEGHTEHSVWYRIYLTVTDSSGATHVTTHDLIPRKSQIRLETNPPGLQVALEGSPVTSPSSVTSVVGVKRRLSVPTPQTLNGTTYNFVSWSNGQPREHEISTPLNATTYTATFATSSTCGGVTLSPVGVSIDAAGTASTVRVSTGEGCSWTVSSDSSWLQPFPIGGSGTQSLSYTAFPNFSTQTRVGRLTVGDRIFTVLQLGASGTANERFVRRIYFSLLGRLPSPADVALQVGQLGIITRSKLFMNFFNSEEFNLGGRYIAGLYVGLLDRNPEYGGWLFQRNALATGQASPNALVTNFLNAAEYSLKFGNPSGPEFVRLLYRLVLLRGASDAEIAFQTAALTSGISRAQLASNFLNSTEFRVGTGPRLTAFLLYALILQRDATKTEFDTLFNQVSSGAPIQTLAETLLNTPEFNSGLQ